MRKRESAVVNVRLLAVTPINWCFL